jgi:hypothetical protein
MNNFQPKFKLIFLPFLIITLCTIVIYTFFNWLLVVRLDTVKMDDDTINFVIPLVIPWVPLAIWMRPRIKLLDLNIHGRRDPVLGILILCWAAIAVPVAIAQPYMITATGKLTRLNNIREINNLPPTKYYTAKEFYINKHLAHVRPVFKVSGKNNDEFNMNLYVAVPVFDHLFPDTNLITAMRNALNPKGLVILNGKLSTMKLLKRLPADSIKAMRYLNPTLVMPKYGDRGKFGALAVVTQGYNLKTSIPQQKIFPVIWLAVKYSKTVSNDLSTDEKQQEFRALVVESDTNFRHTKFEKFNYLDRLPFNKDLFNYINAVKKRGDAPDTAPVLLLPVFQSFDARNGNKLFWMLLSLGLGSGIFLIILNFNPLKPDIMGEGIDF